MADRLFGARKKKSCAILTKLVDRLCSQTMPRRSKRTLSKRLSRLERVTRPEVKWDYKESGAFDTIGSISGTLIQPQQLDQGAGRYQRVGDKVKSRNIRFQGIIKMPVNPSNSTCAVRILCLRAKISNPTTSDMPEWYGHVDEDKFFVLKDILTSVSAVQARTVGGTSFETGSTFRRIKFNLPVGYRKLQYDGSGDSSPLNNEYIIYILAENQSAEFAWNTKHYYIDN